MEDKNIINRTGRHTKIAILWVPVMCGLTLHSLADLMPLFWNEAIAISETGHAPEGLLTFMMSISYLVPVCGILLSLYGKTRSWNILNGLLATFILLFNLFHTCELFTDFSIVQLPLLPVILIVSAILCVMSWKLTKQGQKE